MAGNELTVYCDPGESPAGEIASAAGERSLALIRDLWGLPRPEECRVYVCVPVSEDMARRSPTTVIAWRFSEYEQ